MTNCLGLLCPRCGADTHVEIASHIWLRVTAHGTEAELNGCYEYHPHSPAICTRCGFVGTVRGFEQEKSGGAS